MKTIKITTLLILGILVLGSGQVNAQQSITTTPDWTELDRKYLVDNLIRSKEEILTETKNLTKEQWAFKESADRWSINQVVEHIAICELLLMHEISLALGEDPITDNNDYYPDSLYVETYPNGSNKQDALNYTDPFSFSVPLGNNKGKNNVIWLTTMRNESIAYLKKETANIRLHYDGDNNNVHQIYIMMFGHTDRHLKQIKKVKEHPGYPR